MTPDMSATELVLAQRTVVTEERLRVHWRWGDRFAPMNDEREDAYEACYGKDAAAPLIARKRERETLEALQDVVRYLGGVREERKAILTVTTGWDLFTPQPALLNGGGRVPTVDPAGVGRDGQLTTRTLVTGTTPTRSPGWSATPTGCAWRTSTTSSFFATS
jgi:hypothetical protein